MRPEIELGEEGEARRDGSPVPVTNHRICDRFLSGVKRLLEHTPKARSLIVNEPWLGRRYLIYLRLSPVAKLFRPNQELSGYGGL